MGRDRAIGVDLGGTKIRAGLVSRAGDVEAVVEIATPTQSEEAVLEALGGVVDGLVERGAACIGFGVPCNLSRDRRTCLRATNLPLTDVDLVDHVFARYGVPVGLENDGNAAALAEWRLGAARGATTVVMLTLGTGVGGGFVLDGRLYRGWAEVGHIVVDEGGEPCQGSCHGRGHLEAVTSGIAADRAAERLFGPGADARVLVRGAREGHEGALAALQRMGELLGAGIGSLVNLFDPDVVVVGGGFGAAAGELVLGPARRAAMREAIQPADEGIRIVLAELGSGAGVVGAGLVGFEALDGER